MRSLKARAARLLTRIVITVDSVLRTQQGLPLPADRGNPYPASINLTHAALQLLAEGLSPEEIVEVLEGHNPREL